MSAIRLPVSVVSVTAAAALLVACAGEPPPADRIVPQDPASASKRIQEEMGRLGLLVTSGGDGVISAQAINAPTDWASCPPALVGRGGGNHSSSRLVSVSSRHATVRVVLVTDGDATKVNVTAMFSASYNNPESGSRFDRDCRSSGVLEARLLAAAG